MCAILSYWMIYFILFLLCRSILSYMMILVYFYCVILCVQSYRIWWFILFLLCRPMYAILSDLMILFKFIFIVLSYLMVLFLFFILIVQFYVCNLVLFDDSFSFFQPSITYKTHMFHYLLLLYIYTPKPVATAGWCSNFTPYMYDIWMIPFTPNNRF